jgi:hypothetical protein
MTLTFAPTPMVEFDVEKVLSQLSRQEKIDLLSGKATAMASVKPRNSLPLLYQPSIH